MNELFRETINAAERAAAGDDSRIQDQFERLVNNPGELQSYGAEERAYLAVLLDSIGLQDESIRILQGPAQSQAIPTLQNMEGMLAAVHGQYKRARGILREALSAAEHFPSLRIKILANLAAVSLGAGSVEEAEAWADAVDTDERSHGPAVAVLVASVRAGIASARRDLPGLRSAVASLGKASRLRVAELGTQHPQALAVVANMAGIDIMLARAEGSQDHLERAIDVMEIATLRLVAELGADNLQSLTAMASLASATTDSQLADDSMQKIEHAEAEAEAEAAKVRQPADLAANTPDKVAAPSARARQWRTRLRKHTRMPAQAAAAESARRAERAIPRVGGIGRGGVAGSGTFALVLSPSYGRRSTRSRSSWTKGYRRLAALGDLACAIIGVFVAIELRFGDTVTTPYVALSVVLPVLWLTTLWLAGAYDVRFIGTGSDEFRRVLLAGVSLAAAIAIFSYAVNIELARGYLAIALPGVILLDLVTRYLMRKRLHRLRASGRCMLGMVAVGHTPAVADLINELRRDTYHGLTVVGACIAQPSDPSEVAGVPVYGGLDDVAAAVLAFGADTVAVLACPEMDGIRLRNLAWELEKTGTDLCVSPSLLDVAGPRTTIRPTAGLTLLHVDHPQLSGVSLLLKGLFDRCVALVALTVLAPLMVIIAAAIRLSDRGPALYTRVMVGKDGRAFRIYKFRTMVVDAEQRKAQLIASDDTDGVLFKLRQDPRVTSVGARLRRWSLDELPQLFNVFLGDMSLVGPRPALPDEAARYADHVRRRLVVKPGLTGLWQINGRSDLSWEESVRLDLRYVENWSFALDLQILWKTISVVLRGSGAY